MTLTMGRLPFASAIVIAAGAVVVSAGAALGASEAVVTPNPANPGDEVRFDNGCIEFEELRPDELTVAFTPVTPAAPLAPYDPADADFTTQGRLEGPSTYVFTLPSLSAGAYYIDLECGEGVWTTRNFEEGGGHAVVTILPATSTAPDAAGGRSTFSSPAFVLLGACAAVMAVLWLSRRVTEPGQRR